MFHVNPKTFLQVLPRCSLSNCEWIQTVRLYLGQAMANNCFAKVMRGLRAFARLKKFSPDCAGQVFCIESKNYPVN